MVCTLCKNNYKRRYSGESRSNENSLNPGQEFIDIILIDAHENNMGVLCQNLNTGMVQSHNIENLRQLEVDDLVSLASLDLNVAFKNQLKNSRARNVHGKGVEEDIENEEELYTGYDTEEVEEKRRTRSGTSFVTKLSKGIMKTQKITQPDMHCVSLTQQKASRRGVRLAEELGYSLWMKEAEAIKILPSKSLKIYNVEEKRRKVTHKRKIHFFPNVEVCTDKGKSLIKIKEEIKKFKEGFFSLLANPIGDFSIHETKSLF